MAERTRNTGHKVRMSLTELYKNADSYFSNTLIKIAFNLLVLNDLKTHSRSLQAPIITHYIWIKLFSS